ncbi:uncharacterized protein DUF3307 [Ruminiclostridium sufflavum DSM 19573]|uniref:Uncharacterized protein DUF3307 n=1 Tax=Ruminiclostridium sufflavum DSM 19573 TaxID=1121337 RepID=A0A318XGY7_9FIRM|nr:DUF3307 domain-containing protein [Ruminiclostridium sufflavum]PYG85810.1 uncharacterized protein DUF3307 [Ruminiclostridium sufflavum DSM 19573]
MQNTDFLMLLIFAHLMGDYVLQTSNIAKKKAKSARGIVTHGIIVFFASAVFLGNYGLIGEMAAITISIIHFAIDYAKMKTKKYCKHESIHNIADQMLHLLVIIICYLFFKDMLEEPVIKLKYIGMCNYLIIITYVSTVITKNILCDICEKRPQCNFFLKYERIFDFFIVLIAVLSFFNVLTGAAVSAIAATAFYLAETKYFKYSPRQAVLKAVIYIAFACVFRFLTNY